MTSKKWTTDEMMERRDRQTDKQTDRQTDRQTNTQTNRETYLKEEYIIMHEEMPFKLLGSRAGQY